MRLLHFADLHLGIENYGRIDPATGLHTRFADFVRSFRFVVDLALEERVDAALLAGDVYKTPSPNPTWQREFATQLHRLHEASIPIVLVVGNHDAPASFGRATSVDVFSALELGNTYVVRTPQLLTIETASGPLQVVGLPWPTRHFLRADERYRQCDEESLNAAIEQMCSESIREFAARIDTSSAAVLVAHVAATGALYSGSERTAVIGSDPTLSTSSLANPVFDYVALGHIHRHQDLNPKNSPPVVYAGSVDRIDFGEENDEKGCCLVTIDCGTRAKSTTYRFVPTPARRFVTVNVETEGDGSDPTEAVLAALSDTRVTDAVVRIIYGLSEDADNERRVDCQRILGAMTSAYHVAGIFPKPRASQRQRRAGVSQDMDLAQALDRYIDNNPALESSRADLQRYARELERCKDLAQPEESP